MDEIDLKLRTKKFCPAMYENWRTVCRRGRSGNAIAGQLVRLWYISRRELPRSVPRQIEAGVHRKSSASSKEEADESAFWMELIMEGGLKHAQVVRPASQRGG